MKRILLLLALALALTSCFSIQPPKRPVAYLFPSVTTTQVLRVLQPRPCNALQVAAVLDEIDEQKHFRTAGLLNDEFAIIARGLTSRGYAELDARRTNCFYRWAAFNALSTGGLLVRLPLPKMPDGWKLPENAVCRTEHDANGYPVKVYTLPVPPTKNARAYLMYTVKHDGSEAWERLYVFPNWPEGTL